MGRGAARSWNTPREDVAVAVVVGPLVVVVVMEVVGGAGVV